MMRAVNIVVLTVTLILFLEFYHSLKENMKEIYPLSFQKLNNFKVIL